MAVHSRVGARDLLQRIAAVDDPSLHRIGPIEPNQSRDVWLLTLAELRDTSGIRAFIDHMDGELRRKG